MKFISTAMIAVCCWVVAEFTAVLIVQDAFCNTELESRLILPTSKYACQFE
jgi:hypothetical protein